METVPSVTENATSTPAAGIVAAGFTDTTVTAEPLPSVTFVCEEKLIKSARLEENVRVLPAVTGVTAAVTAKLLPRLALLGVVRLIEVPTAAVPGLTWMMTFDESPRKEAVTTTSTPPVGTCTVETTVRPVWAAPVLSDCTVAGLKAIRSGRLLEKVTLLPASAICAFVVIVYFAETVVPPPGVSVVEPAVAANVPLSAKSLLELHPATTATRTNKQAIKYLFMRS